MTLLSPNHRCIWALGVFLIMTLVPPSPLSAQTVSADGIYYSQQPRFRIPFQVDPGDRRIQRVLLHVSEDQGRHYRQIAEANPGDRGFNFEAREDGSYWFAVQTVDQERRLYPASLDQVQPGLKVYVDTSLPRVNLRAFASRDGTITLEWDIRDDTPDFGTLKLEYRGAGREWQTRGIQRIASGQMTFNPGLTGEVEIRLEIKDKAGNVGNASTRATPGNDLGARPMGGTTGGGQPQDSPSGIKKINSSKISLNYRIDDVGPSDVSSVDVYMTSDGRNWQKYPKPASRTPPFVVEVQGEGRYGFSIHARSGVGLGEKPPQPGDPPQLWVEVDLTPPQVKILDTVVGRGADTGNLTITWSAQDKNLARQPITISYATKLEGPWNQVPGAVNLENTGRYVWRLQNDVPYEFYMRVEAVDEAGNTGKVETTQTVKVDLATPKARVIGIEPVRP